MWQVIQHRWIRGSSQNNLPNVVWEGGRRKEAEGQARHNLNSHLEMLDHHEHFYFGAIVVDTEDHSVSIYDEDTNEPLYVVRYEVKEVENAADTANV